MQMLAGATSTPISSSKSKSIMRSAKRKSKPRGSKTSKSVGPAISKLASVLANAVPSRPSDVERSAESKKREDDYRAEEDLRTLTRAEEVRSDPDRMKHAGRKHREQLSAMQNAGRAFKQRSGSRR